MGNDLMFAIMGNSKSQTLSIPIYDFDSTSNPKECKAIDLWKFSLARERQLPRLAKMASLSFLDEYKIYMHMEIRFMCQMKDLIFLNGYIVIRNRLFRK